MSDLITITDHSDQAIDRLLSQFDDSTNLQSLISSFVDQFQDIEDACVDVREDRYVSTSEGDQMDLLGSIVGAERGGRTDDAYRNLIIAKIGRNTSKGLAENVLSVFNLLTESEATHMLRYYPAEIDLFADHDISALDVDEIREFTQEVLSAGVKLRSVGYYLPTDGFGFFENPDALGFGDTTDPTLGGKFSSILSYA